MKLTTEKRFWISLVLTIPLILQMILMPFHIMIPYYDWLALFVTSLIMFIAAWPYWTSAWAAFKHHNANMNTLVAIGTFIAYFYSIFAMMTGRPVYFESAAFIAVFVLLGDMMEERMHNNASNALKKLMDLQVKDATVLRDGKFMQVPLDQVKEGDIIQVKPGGKIPVDGVVTKGTTTVDEAMVTGESMPVTKTVGDDVIGSTINGDGSIEFKATKVGDETVLAQIVEMVKKAQTSHAPIQNLTDKISGIFVPTVLIIAILTFTIWYAFLGATAVNAMLFAVAVIVIACPCALGLATPTALMVGTSRAAKMGVLIKNGEALEEINDVKTVAFDKTGTITVGKPTVTDIIGNEQQVMEVAASLEATSEHPLAFAIINKAKEMGIKADPLNKFVAVEGQGVTGELNKKTIFAGNLKIVGNAELTPEMKKKAIKLQEEAKTVIFIGIGKKVIGLVAIQDTPKASSAEAIAQLKARGLETVMITGDNQRVAEAIAKQVGIDKVIAGVLPNEKSEVIENLQKNGKVAFVGDGINDAPALTMADVGIAMGSGTDIAIESGNIVLVQNDLRGVVRAFDISQKTFNRIKLNLFWALIYNIVGIPIAAGVFIRFGIELSPEYAALAMAFSSVSVVTSSLLLNKTKIEDDNTIPVKN